MDHPLHHCCCSGVHQPSSIQMMFRLLRSKEPLQKALKLRGYSRKTIKAYCNQVERFLSSFPLKGTDVTTSNVETYCLGLLERGISHSSVNQTISALRFYCKHVLLHPTDIQYISSQEADQASTSVVRKGSCFITQIRNQP